MGVRYFFPPGNLKKYIREARSAKNDGQQIAHLLVIFSSSCLLQPCFSLRLCNTRTPSHRFVQISTHSLGPWFIDEGVEIKCRKMTFGRDFTKKVRSPEGSAFIRWLEPTLWSPHPPPEQKKVQVTCFYPCEFCNNFFYKGVVSSCRFLKRCGDSVCKRALSSDRI